VTRCQRCGVTQPSATCGWVSGQLVCAECRSALTQPAAPPPPATFDAEVVGGGGAPPPHDESPALQHAAVARGGRRACTPRRPRPLPQQWLVLARRRATH
jgi:hypothetical protein